MIFARSVLIWLYVVLSIPVWWLGVFVVWLLTAPFDPRRRILHWFSCWWGGHYVYLSPIWSVKWSGRDRIERRKAYVLTSNHQSLGDILVLCTLHRHFKWVSKASVFKVPFVGWALWMNRHVGVKRGVRGSVEKMMEECRHHLAAGSSIMIFPEGTRSFDGRLQALKPGAFSLAIGQNVPVVPIVIDGTAEALPKHGLMFRQRGRVEIRIQVLPPVDPEPFSGDVDRMGQAVRRLMAEELARLRQCRPEEVLLPT